MTELADRIALVTGASRGIGAATAQALAAAGVKVALLARSEADISRLAQEIGDAAIAIRCDVADANDVAAAVAQTVAHFGALDIVVNNAGLIDPVARIEDSDPADWGRVVDVNVKGVYHVMHAAYPALCRGGGVIVNLSSGAATGALEGWSHYCATKAAVLSLTRCAHKEWAEQGVRVVGLSPGTVATNMQEVIRDSGVNPVSQLDWSAHIPPEDAAQAIVYLCTADARVHDGGDFSIKTEEGRHLAGLAPR
jgi:NAD(P)-dependent dehydrogenase (short-subunit alcohol dehydrogenase family)